MDIDQAIAALNQSVQRSTFQTPYYYDLYAGSWAMGSVNAEPDGQGKLGFGLRLDHGVDIELFQQLAAQAELLIYNRANESGEPMTPHSFELHSLSQTHVMEAKFVLPRGCHSYRCEIRRKQA